MFMSSLLEKKPRDSISYLTTILSHYHSLSITKGLNEISEYKTYSCLDSHRSDRPSNLSKERIAILVNDMLNDSIKKRTKKDSMVRLIPPT